MKVDFAKRASDHLHYDMDPIVRSRLDNDFYKSLMRQFVYRNHPEVEVAFGMTNRTTDVRLADIIPIEAMREQLDHARTLKYENKDLIYLKGNTFYGQENIFKEDFIQSLRDSTLPDYELSANKETGQFVLRTQGKWDQVTDWEDHILTITNEMRNRQILRTISPAHMQITYARAMAKLFAKLEKIAEYPEIHIAEFGTRRRHSYPWQKWVVEMMMEVLGDQFVGTSNTYIARELGCEAIGTNAHELPMVYAALAASKYDDGSPEQAQAVYNSQYEVLTDWAKDYDNNLLIKLPDTFGTTQFLNGLKDGAPDWTGARPDSKEAVEAGEELIDFWKKSGQDPLTKKIIFSDGMDVDTGAYPINGTDIIQIHKTFSGRTQDTYGWGTMATNDFLGCVPGNYDALKPISIVCKAICANGRPTVKISDNPAKAKSIDPSEIDLYQKIFNTENTSNFRTTVV